MKARSFFYGKSILVFLYISTTDFAFSAKPACQESGGAQGGSLIRYKKFKPISHFHPTRGQKIERTGGISSRESQIFYIENLSLDHERCGENKIESREVQTVVSQDLPLLREAIASKSENLPVQRSNLDGSEPSPLHLENRMVEDENPSVENLKEDVWKALHLQDEDLNEGGRPSNRWEESESKGVEEEGMGEKTPDYMINPQDAMLQYPILPPLEHFVESGSLTILPTLDVGLSSTDAGDVKKTTEEGGVLAPEFNKVTDLTEKPTLTSLSSEVPEVGSIKKGIWQKVKGAVYHIFGSSQQDKEGERLQDAEGSNGTEVAPKSPEGPKSDLPEEAQKVETQPVSFGPESKGADPEDPYLMVPPSREDHLNSDPQEKIQEVKNKDAAESKIIFGPYMAYLAPTGSALLEIYTNSFYGLSCTLFVLFLCSSHYQNLAV